MNIALSGLGHPIRLSNVEGKIYRYFVLRGELRGIHLKINGKINKVKMLKDMLDAGSITHSEYLSRMAKILLRI